MKKNTAILLVNLGTPDSPETSDVRKYLKQFLLDPRVIDIAAWQRELLVRLIIAPFRAPKSAKTYKEIWDKTTGSPLLSYSLAAFEKIKASMQNENLDFYFAMRYQTPSIEKALKEIYQKSYHDIIVLPLFPQYASASSGSVQEEVMRIVSSWQIIPNIKFISSFFDHPLYTDAIVQIAKEKYNLNDYDHILFSYHGIPQRQMIKGDSYNHCIKTKNCCQTYTYKNKFCYSAQCFETTRILVEKLQLKSEQYTTCFQSRLGRDPWIQPYTSDVLKKIASEGKKRILCFSPAFVADCLETIYEISTEYHEEFIEMGGECVHLVPSLNTHDTWIACLQNILEKQIHYA